MEIRLSSTGRRPIIANIARAILNNGDVTRLLLLLLLLLLETTYAYLTTSQAATRRQIKAVYYPRRATRRVMSCICDFVRVCVCLSVCSRSKRKTTRAINAKVGTDVVRGSRWPAEKNEVEEFKGRGYTVMKIFTAWDCMSTRLHVILVYSGTRCCTAQAVGE